MMKNRNISSLAELQLEIGRVKTMVRQQEEQLLTDTKSFFEQLTLLRIFNKIFKPSGLLKIDEKTHLSSSILAFVLPFLVNKTILRKSGFITKSIGALISGKLGQSLSADKLLQIFVQAKSWLGAKDKKKGTLEFDDYGIPPDSETY